MAQRVLSQGGGPRVTHMIHGDLVRREAQRAVRHVGLFPKVFSAVLSVVTLYAIAVGNNFSLFTPGLALAIIPIFFLAISLRVKAVTGPDSIVFRSYFRTYEFRLSEIIALDIEPYDGLWFRGVAVEGVLGLWLTRITVVLHTGREQELQSSVMFLWQARRLVRDLSPYLPNLESED